MTRKLTLEERREQWASDFDAADRGVMAMLHRRQVFRGIGDVLNASAVKRHPTVDNYLVDTYVAAITLAVRRESDPDTRTTSLARCLQQLMDSPKLITRESFIVRYLESFPETAEDEASRGFQPFAPFGGDVLDQSMLRANLDELRDAGTAVRNFANRFIAHRERLGDAGPPTLTFEEVDRAVNAIAAVAQRFWSLAHPGTMRAQMTPIVDLTYIAMFQQPWVTDNFTLTQRADDHV